MEKMNYKVVSDLLDPSLRKQCSEGTVLEGLKTQFQRHTAALAVARGNARS